MYKIFKNIYFECFNGLSYGRLMLRMLMVDIKCVR